MTRSRMHPDPVWKVVVACRPAAHRVLAALAIAIATLIGTTITGLTASLADAIALHDAARGGDKDAAKPAIEMLTALNRAYPENVEILAYLGGSYAQVADYENNLFARISNGKKSLKLLDQALVQAPENFTVRMVRAWVHSAMPKFLGYKEKAIDDMLALHRIFSNLDTPSKKMAETMVPFYEHLLANAPERGDWRHWLDHARSIEG